MKLNLEITDRQAAFLRQFAQKQHEGADDNLGTYKPLHLVQTRDEDIIRDGGECSDRSAYYSDVLGEHYDDEKDMICELTGNGDALSYEDARYNEINGIYVYSIDDYFKAYGAEGCSVVSIAYNYRTVAYFFTLEEARKYAKYQAHNLKNPRIYTVGAGYGNKGDYEPFFDLLMSIGTELLRGVENDEM